jgi:hypothetical protein
MSELETMRAVVAFQRRVVAFAFAQVIFDLVVLVVFVEALVR